MSAKDILLWLLICLNAAAIFWGLIESSRLYRFTVFAAATFFGFAIPQLYGLSQEGGVGFRHHLPDGALDLTILMCTLCMAALWFGDLMGYFRPGTSAIQPLSHFDSERILQFGFALMLVGNLIYHVSISFMSQEELDSLGNQWSGSITIVLFFAGMSKYGFAIMTYMYFRTRSPAALLCVLAGLLLQLIVFVAGARRGEAANTFFVLMLGLFFARRIIVPAWLLGVIFVVGTLWSNSVGSFRNKEEAFLEKLEKAEMLTNFANTLNNGGAEMTNCAVHIWCAENNEEGAFDFGAYHWNQLVHAYFPGQIFGYDLKYALKMLDRDLPKEMLGYRGPLGTTPTGMTDAFESFWWFGAIKFYLIGYVMGRWYNRACRGDLWSQLAYMAIMSPALHTITHNTNWIVNSYLHMLMFAWPGLAWAKLPVQHRQHTVQVDNHKPPEFALR